MASAAPTRSKKTRKARAPSEKRALVRAFNKVEWGSRGKWLKKQKLNYSHIAYWANRYGLPLETYR